MRLISLLMLFASAQPRSLENEAAFIVEAFQQANGREWQVELGGTGGPLVKSARRHSKRENLLTGSPKATAIEFLNKNRHFLDLHVRPLMGEPQVQPLSGGSVMVSIEFGRPDDIVPFICDVILATQGAPVEVTCDVSHDDVGFFE